MMSRATEGRRLHDSRPNRESASRRLGPTLSQWILARDGHRCVYCGAARDLTFDHLTPRRHGGADSPSNVVTACRRCNSIRKDLCLRGWVYCAKVELGLELDIRRLRRLARRRPRGIAVQ